MVSTSMYSSRHVICCWFSSPYLLVLWLSILRTTQIPEHPHSAINCYEIWIVMMKSPPSPLWISTKFTDPLTHNSHYKINPSNISNKLLWIVNWVPRLLFYCDAKFTDPLTHNSRNNTKLSKAATNCYEIWIITMKSPPSPPPPLLKVMDGINCADFLHSILTIKQFHVHVIFTLMQQIVMKWKVPLPPLNCDGNM